MRTGQAERETSTKGRRASLARFWGAVIGCALTGVLTLPLVGPAAADPPPPPAAPAPAPNPAPANPPAPNPAPPNDADRREAPKPPPAGAPKPPPAQPVVAPQGVRVTKTFWYTDRHVALWVHSPAMNTDIQVQLLLARDWWSRPTAKFPQLTMLDGLRAQDDQNGWVINTNVVDFYKDKNLNVILPVGGESSFYTNWLQPDRGKNYQWETFLIKELPTIVERDWRSTDVRGVEGLSMGGTAAMMLATRNPGFYKFAASFSGILQLTSLGMQPAIQFAMRDAGEYDSQKMFGLPSNPAWREHDPYLLADQLRGTSVYISSGNGVVGPHDKPTDIPLLATNYSGVGLELLSRVTSQQFASELNRKGIPGQAVYRPSGTHTWPYWQFEMTQAWPQAASALGLSEDRPACRTSGAIKKAYTPNRRLLGECLTPEYSVAGGRAQDFRGGRIITGPKGPKIVGGAIGGAYVSVGGPGGKLGLPTVSERTTKDRKGKVAEFQRGKITWTPRRGAIVGK